MLFLIWTVYLVFYLFKYLNTIYYLNILLEFLMYTIIQKFGVDKIVFKCFW